MMYCGGVNRTCLSGLVQRTQAALLACMCGWQVVQFGSVPLKTYLPDGDIDLTALSHNTELKETWAGNVQDVLREAEQNVDAEFRVKEVQYIHADVSFIMSTNL